MSTCIPEFYKDAFNHPGTTISWALKCMSMWYRFVSTNTTKGGTPWVSLVGRPAHVDFAIFDIITKWYPISHEEFTRDGWVETCQHSLTFLLYFIPLDLVWERYLEFIKAHYARCSSTMWNIRVPVNLMNHFIARIFGYLLTPYHFTVLLFCDPFSIS